jgi:hypothetical protein
MLTATAPMLHTTCDLALEAHRVHPLVKIANVHHQRAT